MMRLSKQRQRAVCPKCGKPNSKLYEFNAKDFRLLKCSECHEVSPYQRYFVVN